MKGMIEGIFVLINSAFVSQGSKSVFGVLMYPLLYSHTVNSVRDSHKYTCMAYNLKSLYIKPAHTHIVLVALKLRHSYRTDYAATPEQHCSTVS